MDRVHACAHTVSLHGRRLDQARRRESTSQATADAAVTMAPRAAGPFRAWRRWQGSPARVREPLAFHACASAESEAGRQAPSGVIPERWPRRASRAWTPSALAAAAVAVLCVLVITGCGGSARSARTRAAPSSHGLLPRKTVQARRLRPEGPNSLPNGTRVGKRFLGSVFANPRDGFGLGGQPGTTYPIATVDGGKTWRTSGPLLYIPAVHAAVAVNEAGMSGPRFWYAWGHGLTVIDVTTDAGKSWWQTFLPGRVLTVYADQISRCNRLIALIQPLTKRTHPPLWTYASANGRHWTYAANPSAASDC